MSASFLSKRCGRTNERTKTPWLTAKITASAWLSDLPATSVSRFSVVPNPCGEFENWFFTADDTKSVASRT
ncbi:FeS assembly protein SufD [Anopheles sinensis]|uniref:FeS assembly protein SufD n=1 Tax=Anopheles sinensis TaxID=74873 RepID=A0A084VQK3_ANOSI|nr:FeS assembly protein SufD [Anopheles sinensis]